MDDSYYGWISILSGELVIEGTLFENSDLVAVKKLFASQERQILLSDKLLDVLFRLKHTVEYNNVSFKKCDECNEHVLYLSIKVSNWRGDKLLGGNAWIHKNGFVKYKIASGDLEPPSPERIMHKIIRDIFHIHVHHSSDLPLPPINAKCGDDGKKKILNEYLLKFIQYKRLGAKVKKKDALENLSRARGEITYAENAAKLLTENTQEYPIIESFKLFDKAFSVLIDRLALRLRLATSYELMALTLLLISIGIFQLSSTNSFGSINLLGKNVEYLCLLASIPFILFIYYMSNVIFEGQK